MKKFKAGTEQSSVTRQILKEAGQDLAHGLQDVAVLAGALALSVGLSATPLGEAVNHSLDNTVGAAYDALPNALTDPLDTAAIATRDWLLPSPAVTGPSGSEIGNSYDFQRESGSNRFMDGAEQLP